MRAEEFIVELSFYGRPCTKDCSGHRAGWEWERKHQTNVKQATPSPSFNNGTDVAISQRKAGKHPIGSMARGEKGRFQKIQRIKESDQELDELTGVKKYRELTFDQMVSQIAKDFGLTAVTGGRFGKVLLSSDPRFVYKVIEQDDAYLSFVNFVMKNQNPHYPVIKKIKPMTAFYARYNIQPNKFTVVKIERLLPLEFGTAQFASDLADMDDLYDSPSYLPNGNANYENYTVSELAETRPWIIDLWYAIKAIQRSKVIKGNEDMHPGNFMKRADHTVVIIDPVSDPKGFKLSRQIGDLERAGEQPQLQGPVYKKTRRVRRKGP